MAKLAPLSVTISGTPISPLSVSIQKSLDGYKRSASIKFQATYGDASTFGSSNDEVAIRDASNNLVFSGYVTRSDPDVVSNSRVYVTVTCADQRLLLDGEMVYDDTDPNYVKTYTAQDERAIIQDMVSNFGVSGYTAPNGTVETGVTLTMKFNGTFPRAMDLICEQTNKKWTVDANKVIHYFTPSNEPADFSLGDGDMVREPRLSEQFQTRVNRITVFAGRARAGDSTFTAGQQIIVTRNNTTSQAVYGIIHRPVWAVDVTTTEAAQNLADEILAQAAFPNRVLTVSWYGGANGERDGLEPGQLLTVTHDGLDLNAEDFIVQSVTLEYTFAATAGYEIKYTAQCGTYLPSLVRALRNMEGRPETYVPTVGVGSGTITEQDLAFQVVPPYVPQEFAILNTTLTIAAADAGSSLTGTVSNGLTSPWDGVSYSNDWTGTGTNFTILDEGYDYCFVVRAAPGSHHAAKVITVTDDTHMTVDDDVSLMEGNPLLIDESPCYYRKVTWATVLNLSDEAGQLISVGIKGSGSATCHFDSYLRFTVDGQAPVMIQLDDDNSASTLNSNIQNVAFRLDATLALIHYLCLIDYTTSLKLEFGYVGTRWESSSAFHRIITTCRKQKL